MGQNMASECYCHDGLMQLCAPSDEQAKEDPGKEVLVENKHPPTFMPTYPMSTPLDRNADPLRSVPTGFDSTEEGAFIAEPPPYEENTPMGGLPPPSAVPHGAQSSPLTALPVDEILSNLEGAEEVFYAEAFATFPGGRDGFIGLDCAAMRDFICTNSAITMQDIDMELLKMASPDQGLTREAFLHLLREFSVSEGDSISHFLNMSTDGQSLASEECRTGLLLFAQQQLSTNFSEERWESIFNTVMRDAGVMVTMEQWLFYSKLTARTARLLQSVQVQKAALGLQGSNMGVIGGA